MILQYLWTLIQRSPHKTAHQLFWFIEPGEPEIRDHINPIMNKNIIWFEVTVGDVHFTQFF